MQTYQAYLLRLWRESETGPWRASLEDPTTGERLGFAGADRLLAYLAQRLLSDAPPAPEPPKPPDEA